MRKLSWIKQRSRTCMICDKRVRFWHRKYKLFRHDYCVWHRKCWRGRNKLKENDIVRIKYPWYMREWWPAKWRILTMTADGDGTAIIENMKTSEQTIIELSKLRLY